MKSWSNKSKIAVIAIIAIAIISGILFLKYRSNELVVPPKINYPFRNDGTLSFLSDNKRDTLAIIEIQIVRNSEEITRGLMNRDSLGWNRGMLFVFDREEDRTFWMKNTRFSLDIIFINNEKEILYIAEHTTPYSTNPIPGFYPARYVLEVNAGFCRIHNITPGTLIDY